MKNSVTLFVVKDIWKDVVGYESLYEINKDGAVKRIKRIIVRSDGKLCSYKEDIVKTRVDRAGYISTRLSKSGHSKSLLVHRLVALTFIPNTLQKPFVNHLNGVKTDNRVENLEWVTHSENVLHAFETGLNKNKGENHYEAIKVFNICSGELWNTIKEAAAAMGTNYNTLRHQLRTQGVCCLKKVKLSELEIKYPASLN